ncbi:prepilin-type N-terminal cleavage/methylation domain-containing protein [Pseudomonas sp.]|uniref:prepilin-type N-terminal cleavage/methylation domain-containing protein n=1 Tax=Pseudomonas sp. TaxID=306 RepID=UPI00289A3C00|nr:prepilin-type N-terminal cleavage/methylation domain-containing protein [Pseudomonas sp.]
MLALSSSQTQTKTQRNVFQKGFTLIEMLITIIIIGIIAAILYPIINNMITSQANARKYMALAENIVHSASLMNQTMRAPLAVTGNPLTASGNTLLDAIIVGDKVSGLISTTYASRYATSGVRPMSDAVEITTAPTSGGSGTYTINDSTVSLVAISNRQMGVQYTNVPTELVQYIFEQREAGTFNGGTARTTGVVRYSAVSGGNHATMTLVYDL